MKYDLHCHTWYSPCSLLSPPIFLKFISRKMDGVAITDHDTIKGYEVARKLNKDREFKIIKAVEKTTDRGHVLAYYINEVPKTNNFFEVLDSFRAQGAIVAIAHPFSYVKKHKFNFSKEAVRKVDAIECRNASMNAEQNHKAVMLANKYNISKIGGSDSHFVSEVGLAYTRFEGDLRMALKKRETFAEGKLKYFVLNQFASSILSLARK